MEVEALASASKLVCHPNCFYFGKTSVSFLPGCLVSLGRATEVSLREQLSEESRAELASLCKLKYNGANTKKKRARAVLTAIAQWTASEVLAGAHVVLQGVAFGEAQLGVFGLSGADLLQQLGGQAYSDDAIKALYYLLHLGVTVPPPTAEFFTAATRLFKAPTALPCCLECVKRQAPLSLFDLEIATPPGHLPQPGLDPEDVPSEPLTEQATGGLDHNVPSTSAAQMAGEALELEQERPIPVVPQPAPKSQLQAAQEWPQPLDHELMDQVPEYQIGNIHRNEETTHQRLGPAQASPSYAW